MGNVLLTPWRSFANPTGVDAIHKLGSERHTVKLQE